MGEWRTSVLCGLGAGVLVAVLAVARRGGPSRWTGGGRLAVLIVVAVVLGAAVPAVLQRPAERRLAGPYDDVLERIAAALAAPDLDRRMGGLANAHRLAERKPSALPEIIVMLSAFVRDRTTTGDDPRCAGSEPEEDVASALAVLRARVHVEETDPVIDLRGTCLANAQLGSLHAPGAELADANLSGARVNTSELPGADLARADLSGASLVGVDLTGARLVDARFADTDLSGARFSDDTLWPPQHEDAVMAASSFETTTFVIGELVLSDPG